MYSQTINVKLAVLAAFAEVLPIEQHDNIFVTLSCFAYAYYPSQTVAFVCFCCLISVFYTRRKFTGPAAVVGVLVVFLHYLASRRAFGACVLFGVLGTLSSSYKKRRLSAASNNDPECEQRRGRSAFQVLQNSLVSLSFCFLFFLSGQKAAEFAAVCASAECLADTLASDLGMALGGTVYSSVSLKRV